MKRMTMVCAVTCAILSAVPAFADAVMVNATPLDAGASWIEARVEDASALPRIEPGWEGRTFWDLRPPQAATRLVDWRIVRDDEGLVACASDRMTGTSEGCRPAPEAPDGLHAGMRIGSAAAVAEGVALLPAGPMEVVLLRQVIDGRLRYTFLNGNGETAALYEGPLPAIGMPFLPDRGELLAQPAVDDNIEIAYSKLSEALSPGRTGFLQYSQENNVALGTLHPQWSTVQDMISIDQTGVAYQPDPDDPGSSITLPEVWDFTPISTTVLDFRTFSTTRDDVAGLACGQICTSKDSGPNPPDGTWQAYLKIDNYSPGGAYYTRDLFTLNDNDTGANPSIDVPFVAQDELNQSSRTQLCFNDSLNGGGVNLPLKFFQFTGASPAVATLGVSDTWDSGAWTGCNNADGLYLTQSSACGNFCYPTCDGIAAPRARGRLSGSGAGFRGTIVEDGWVAHPSGNFIKAILMRQDTDLEAGAELFGTCNISAQTQRAFDYFWIEENYGLLALISSPTSDTIAPDDWTLANNETDGADVLWGPLPPHQTQAEACLAGTRVSWALPLDGTNLNAAPNVSNFGYVVSWGSATDPAVLADWDTNPNRTPKPGEAGYLISTVGNEPTSYIITGWGGTSINATVSTALQYNDPDVGDTTAYRSAAYYKVVENPAKLDAGTFTVGDGVTPFVTEAGADLQLDWPAVAGAAGYALEVYDLDLRAEIACPAGLNCTPATNTATHVGGRSSSANYGYRAFAVDPCGALSAN